MASRMNILLLFCIVGCMGQELSTQAPVPLSVEDNTPDVFVDNSPATAAASPNPSPSSAGTTSSAAPSVPTTSSTDATTTTTDSTTTSSSSTTAGTTEAPVVPTTSSPSTDEYYRVTENNVTCVIFGGDVKFTISYPTTMKKNSDALISLPRPSDTKHEVSSTGSCGTLEDGVQSISVNWGPTNTRSSYTLRFNSSGDKWEMISTDASLYIDPDYFANATDAGQFLKITGQYPGLTFVPVDTNSSFTCRAAIDSKNFTATVMNTNTTYATTSTVIGFKGQAYNTIPFTTDLQEGIRCEADMTSDLVPIAVGCALAGLVVLVLISYLVGRRRRSAAYQSV